MTKTHNKRIKKHRILLIGATGFTGGRVLHELTQSHPEAEVTCLIRHGRMPPDIPDNAIIKIVRGDLSDIDSLKMALAGKDGLIYVASLGFGHASNIVSACEESGVKKCVFTSTTAIFTKLNAPTKKIREAAEKSIMKSSLNWCIIRPTMIYGRSGDRNMERLVKYIQRFPILFVPGTAEARQQPNHVDDVACALVDAYFSPHTNRKAYNISGAEPLTFRDVVTECSRQIDKKIKICELPLTPIRILLRLYAKVTSHPKIKEEQLLRLNEDKVFDHTEATKDFNYAPKKFAEGISILLNEKGVL